MKLKEIAKILGIHINQVKGLVKRGRIKPSDDKPRFLNDFTGDYSLDEITNYMQWEDDFFK